jgi:hypothetical protein
MTDVERIAFVAGDGSFRLGPFAPGMVEVRELFHTQYSGTFHTTETPTITLPEPGWWSATITLWDKATGSPLEVKGKWRLISEGSGLSGQPFQTLVNGQFSAEAKTLPAGRPATLAIVADGYSAVEYPDVRIGSQEFLEFHLESVRPIEVVVEGDGSGPIPGATVKILWPAALRSLDETVPRAARTERVSWFKENQTRSMASVTDAQGRASFRLEIDDRAKLLVEAAGYLSLARSLSGLERATPLRITLSKP